MNRRELSFDEGSRLKFWLLYAGFTGIIGEQQGKRKKSMYNEEMMRYFASVLEQDRAAVVICDLNHTIV